MAGGGGGGGSTIPGGGGGGGTGRGIGATTLLRGIWHPRGGSMAGDI